MLHQGANYDTTWRKLQTLNRTSNTGGVDRDNNRVQLWAVGHFGVWDRLRPRAPVQRLD